MVARKNEMDVFVGKKIRECRERVDMSQEQLGKKLGVSFQQIQKYENGQNRVASGRLFLIAKFLNVPVEYFFGKSLSGHDNPIIDEIVLERRRQVLKGYSAAHDDEHADGRLALYAANYAMTSSLGKLNCGSIRRGNLVRAAALIVAEIERIDRAWKRSGGFKPVLHGINPSGVVIDDPHTQQTGLPSKQQAA